MQRLERNLEVLSLIDQCHPKTLSKKLTNDNVVETFTRLREEENLVLYKMQDDDEKLQVDSEEIRKIHRTYSNVNKGRAQPANTVGHFLEYWMKLNSSLEFEYQPLNNLITSVLGEWSSTLRASITENSISSLSLTKPKILSHNIKSSYKNNESAPNSQNMFLPNDQVLDKLQCIERLKDLFDFYTHKRYKSHKKTFDDINETMQKMDLTTWMVFNKDSNTLSILGKQIIYRNFRKYSCHNLLEFSAFYRAIKDVILHIHPDNPQNGWKMLGVHNQKAATKRFSSLGVPSFLATLHKSNLTKQKQHDSIFKTIDLPQLAINPKLRPPRKYSKLTIDKLMKIKAKPHIVLPPSEPEDSIYLKEYPIAINPYVPKKQKEFKYVVPRLKFVKCHNYSDKALQKKSMQRLR